MGIGVPETDARHFDERAPVRQHPGDRRRRPADQRGPRHPRSARRWTSGRRGADGSSAVGLRRGRGVRSGGHVRRRRSPFRSRIGRAESARTTRLPVRARCRGLESRDAYAGRERRARMDPDYVGRSGAWSGVARPGHGNERATIRGRAHGALPPSCCQIPAYADGSSMKAVRIHDDRRRRRPAVEDVAGPGPAPAKCCCGWKPPGSTSSMSTIGRACTNNHSR